MVIATDWPSGQFFIQASHAVHIEKDPPEFSRWDTMIRLETALK
jgi:hypothetical protein